MLNDLGWRTQYMHDHNVDKIHQICLILKNTCITYTSSRSTHIIKKHLVISIGQLRNTVVYEITDCKFMESSICGM